MWIQSTNKAPGMEVLPLHIRFPLCPFFSELKED